MKDYDNIHNGFVYCRNCKHLLASDCHICMYQHSKNEFHLIIRPEVIHLTIPLDVNDNSMIENKEDFNLLNVENNENSDLFMPEKVNLSLKYLDNNNNNNDNNMLHSMIKKLNYEKKKKLIIPYKIHCINCQKSIGSQCKAISFEGSGGNGNEGIICFDSSGVNIIHSVLFNGLLPTSNKKKKYKWKDVYNTIINNIKLFDNQKASKLVDLISLRTLSEIENNKNEIKYQPLTVPNKEEIKKSFKSKMLVSQLRKYQCEAVVYGLLSNTFLYLPTGCGKTLIAIKLIDEFCRLNPSKKAVFIVPKIPLVTQQSNYIRRETKLKVLGLWGESAKSTIRKFNETNMPANGSHRLGDSNANVIVITPMLLSNFLEWNEINIREISILIFDEAHHAKKDHEYRQILTTFVHVCEKELRPRILALSASPSSNFSSQEKIGQALDMLVQLFESIVVTPTFFQDDLERYIYPVDAVWHTVKETNEEIHLVNALEQYIISMEEILKKENVLPYDVSLLSLPRYAYIASNSASLQRLVGEIRALEDTAFYTKNHRGYALLCHINSVLTCFESIRVNGARRTKQDLHLYFKALKKQPDPDEKLKYEIVEEKARVLLNKIVLAVDDNLECSYSSRIQLLIAEVSKLDLPLSPRVIVFVNRRRMARWLLDTLQEIPLFKEYRPARFVGHNGYDGMDWDTEQSVILDRFRKGYHKLLVSTSILEEGLDVPSCSLVVRFDGVCGFTGFVQSRGRARKIKSKFVILASELERQQEDKMKKCESVMLHEVVNHPSSYLIMSDVKDTLNDIAANCTVIRDDVKHSNQFDAEMENGKVNENDLKTESLERNGTSSRETYAVLLRNIGKYLINDEEKKLILFKFKDLAEIELFDYRHGLLALRPFTGETIISSYQKICKNIDVNITSRKNLWMQFVSHEISTGVQPDNLDFDMRTPEYGLQVFNRGEFDNNFFRVTEEYFNITGLTGSSTGSLKFSDVKMSLTYTLKSQDPDKKTRTFLVDVFFKDMNKVIWLDSGTDGIIKIYFQVLSTPFFYEHLISVANNIIEESFLRQLHSFERKSHTFCLQLYCLNAMSDWNLRHIFSSASIITYDTKICDRYCKSNLLGMVPINTSEYVNGNNDDITVNSSYKPYIRLKDTKTPTNSSPCKYIRPKRSRNDKRQKGKDGSSDNYINISSSSESRSMSMLSDLEETSLECESDLEDSIHMKKVKRIFVITENDDDGWNKVSLPCAKTVLDIWPNCPSFSCSYALLSFLSMNCHYLSDNISCEIFYLLDSLKSEHGDEDILADLLINFSLYSEVNLVKQFKEYLNKNLYLYGGDNVTSMSRITRKFDLVYKVVITPCRTIYYHPEQASSNRAFRHFNSQNFMYVHFQDEDLSMLDTSDNNVMKRIEESLLTPLSFHYIEKEENSNSKQIRKKDYRFLTCSTSQLRNRSCVYTSINLEEIREWAGELSDIRCPGKYLSRFSQVFSSTKDSKVVVKKVKLLNAANDITVNSLMTSAYSWEKEIEDSSSDVEDETPDEDSDSMKEGSESWSDSSELENETPSGKTITENFSACTGNNKDESLRFTDGVGEISIQMAEQIAKNLGFEIVPAAYQIRLGGAKGVLLISDKVKTVKLRKSMVKYQTKIHFNIEVVASSCFSPAFLNRQKITILNDLGVPSKYFFDLQEKYLTELRLLLSVQEKAADAIKQNMPQLRNYLLGYLETGSLLSTEAYFHSLARCHYEYSLNNLVTRARIPVDQGRTLIGVADFTRTLKYGEVFIQISGQINDGHMQDIKYTKTDCGGRHIVLTGTDVIVCRSPCHHPGDIRLLTCRGFNDEGKEALPGIFHKYVDVIVFPCDGMRPHPDECSGGDLDGDVYTVIWDKRLIPEKSKIAEPMEFNSTGKTMSLDHNINDNDLVKFFMKYVQEENLGSASNAHLAISDLSDRGCFDEKAIELAKICSLEVDFAKTEEHAKIPPHLRPQEFPDYMEKVDKPSYPSQKPLGILYRRCKDLRNLSFAYLAGSLVDTSFLSKNFEKYVRHAEMVYNQYSAIISTLQKMMGITTESQLASGLVYTVHPLLQADIFKAGEQAKERFYNIQKSFRTEFENFFLNKNNIQFTQENNLEDEKLDMAAAWYFVSYRVTDPKKRFLSFPWIVGDYLLINKKKNITSSSFKSTVTSSPMALDVTIKKLTDSIDREISSLQYELISSYMLRKNAILQLSHFLDRNGKLIMFGSSELLTFEEISDIDCFLIPTTINNDNSDSNNNLEHFYQILRTEYKDTEIIQGTRVPIIKLTCSEFSVDITLQSNGPLKTWIFRFYIKKYPFFWPSIYILLNWAKQIGLLRRRSGGGHTLFSHSTIFIWFFIKYCIQHNYIESYENIIKEIGIEYIIKECEQDIDGSKFWTEISDHIKSLIYINDINEENSICPGNVIISFLTFYANRSLPENEYSCEDPFDPINNMQLDNDSIFILRQKCNYSLHSLYFYGGDVQSILARKEDHISVVCLSKGLSSRIADCQDFYQEKIINECPGLKKNKKHRFGDYNVKIVFKPQPNIKRIGLYIAEISGDSYSVRQVENKIKSLENELSCFVTRSSSEGYYTQGASLVLFEGAMNIRERLGFQRYHGKYHQWHNMALLHQGHLLSYTYGLHWYSHAETRFLSRFIKQIKDLNDYLNGLNNDNKIEVKTEKIKATIRFGYHYLIHIPRSFSKETIAFATIEALEEAFEKGRISRQLNETVLISKKKDSNNEKNDITDSEEMDHSNKGIRSHPHKRYLNEIDMKRLIYDGKKGVTHSFYTCLLEKNEHLIEMYTEEKKFKFVDESKGYALSLGYENCEYKISFDDDFNIRKISTRPCRWFACTLKMRQETDEDGIVDGTPDIRYYITSKSYLPMDHPIRLILDKVNKSNKKILQKNIKTNQVEITDDFVTICNISPLHITTLRGFNSKKYINEIYNIHIIISFVTNHSVPSEKKNIDSNGYMFHKIDSNIETEFTFPSFDIKKMVLSINEMNHFSKAFLQRGVDFVEFLRKKTLQTDFAKTNKRF